MIFRSGPHAIRAKTGRKSSIFAKTACNAGGPAVAQRDSMSFATVVDRVRAEFREMPGLELTMPQAVRLWSLGPDDCRNVIDALIDAGFLRWTARRTIVWTGRDLAVAGPREPQNVFVGRVRNRANSVDR